MGTIYSFLNLALAQEDNFGKVLAGSTGKNAKELWKNSAQGANNTRGRISNFIKATDAEVLKLDKSMSLASDVFDKGTLKAIRKSGKTNKEFYTKLVDLFSDPKNIKEDDIAKLLKDSNITQVKESKGIIKKITSAIRGDKAVVNSADDITAKAMQKLGDVVKTSADDAVAGSAKAGKGFLKSLKGKGGSLGIALSVLFEIPEIVKAFKNGDGMKQVGRSTISVAGFSAGAAAGAAIGSVIPVAGTAVGALVGGLCGIVGGMIGGSISNKIGNALFGKSIADKKQEQQEAQEQAMAQMQQLQYQQYNQNLNTFA